MAYTKRITVWVRETPQSPVWVKARKSEFWIKNHPDLFRLLSDSPSAKEDVPKSSCVEAVEFLAMKAELENLKKNQETHTNIIDHQAKTISNLEQLVASIPSLKQTVDVLNEEAKELRRQGIDVKFFLAMRGNVNRIANYLEKVADYLRHPKSYFCAPTFFRNDIV